MTDPHQQLQDALDALDTAFAPLAQPPAPVGGCTHCYTEADLEALAGPVQLVPEELLHSVAHKTPDHWDDFPGLYRRLTPRIVRLLTTDQIHHSIVASRLLAADWRTWPRPERTALERVWHAWWRAALHTHPSTGHITEILETLAHWLFRGQLGDLHLGFYDELYVTPELVPWLLSLEDGRIGAAHLIEVERIAYS
ncbi:hypothetical protein ACFWXK_22880 [Streptomyces sp. NPDC059070]|uniref:hypothetical protein n=1 Tax=Streptomyces sp. NPDC059070 TaxID=3346713 RepID=UPI0036BE0095